MSTNFSIRNLLQGELQQFVRDSGFECLPTLDFVRDLTCLLAAYREEDVALFPEVFVCPSIGQLSTLSPGTERVGIGEKPLSGDLAAKVLKDCGPLATNGWSIYVAKLSEGPPPSIEYGVFRSLCHSFATSAEESMQEAAGAAATLLIRNRGHLIVELRNAKGDGLTVSFTSAPAAESKFISDIGKFVGATTASLSPDKGELFRPYLRRLLIDTLQHCHGTLLAAFKRPSDGKCPEQFKKGVWLKAPLALADAHAQATTAKDADSLARLQSLEVLLAGMINSDGVVVLGTDGSVLGYRVFLNPSEEEKKSQEQEGGGRRRTYSLMVMRLGGDLEAAFFRSQDGATACERKQT